MENLKTILSAKSHVFGNIYFSNIYGQKSLSCTQIKFVVEELNGEVYFDLP